MSERHPERRGAVFWVSAAVGWAIVGFGVLTLLQRANATRPVVFGLWFVGLAVVHDLVVAPSASLAGRIGRRLPSSARPVVFVAAVVSVALALVALPPLLGEPGGNASLLPRDPVAGLALALAAVWVLAALVLIVRRVRGRR